MSKYNKKVSYSQYQQWTSCPQQYKLNYVDKVTVEGESSSNINLIFGSALHEVIQHFLKVMYTDSKKEALSIDMDKLLLEKMTIQFQKEVVNSDGSFPCTREELKEYYTDGVEILRYFKSKLTSFYNKSGIELVGIELKLEEEVKSGLDFIGYIDVILYDKVSCEYIIIDLKSSNHGWSSYKKNDKVTTSQMLIYKKLYADKFDVPLDKIKVEYQIFKRKLDDDSEYPIPRISKFVPPSGKPSVNMAWNSFMDFVNSIFDENGNRRTDESLYPPVVAKPCEWCVFKESGYCSAWPK